MPRVHHRKARKDYPEAGIAKGDMYYTTSIKTGAYSSRTLRQKTPFKQSQLTTSEFRQEWYSAQEEWDASDKSADAAREAAEAIRAAGEGAQERYDAMPDGLQQGETGCMLEERASTADTVASNIDTFAEELEGLDREDFEDEDAFEDEIERLVEEIDTAFSEMPD